MATWPTSLPQCGEHRGWSEDPGKIVLKSDMESGPPKRRARFSAAYPIYTMAMTLTLTQWQTLNTFYKANPAASFTWTDPEDLSSADVVFDSRPKITSRVGSLFIVQFSIEVQL